MKEENDKIEKRLKKFHSIDQFEDIGRELMARDMCLIDNCIFRRGKQPSSGRVESNLMFLGEGPANKVFNKRNAGGDVTEHNIALFT
jgi:hypothetical protein